MSSNANVLQIFLASPGDLNPERQRTREIVDDLNRTLAKEANTFITLLGWEDTLPGTGRPQHLINDDVSVCDLFIGILWKRWGTASGKYSSGFEEEFSLAFQRHKDSGSPEIWLAFKLVAPDQLADPGEQLQKVISFRESIQRSRSLLYKQFESTEDWAGHLRTWLSTLLFRRIRAQLDALRGAEESTQTPSSISEASEDQTSSEADEKVPDTIAHALRGLPSLTSTPTKRDFEDALDELSDSNLAHLTLALRAAGSQRLSADTLTVHELNLLYLHRDRISPFGPETDIILRTMFEDNSDTHPGWFWFKGNAVEDVVAYALHLSAHDGSTSVRRGASNFLKRWLLPPPSSAVLVPLLDSQHPEIKDVLIEWLGRVGDGEHDEVLRKLAAAEADRRDAADQALLISQVRRSPNEVVKELTKLPNVPTGVRDVIVQSLPNFSDSSLEEMVSSPTGWMRHTVAEELYRRGLLSEQLSRSLMQDSSMSVKEVGVRRLAEIGELSDLKNIRALIDEKEANKGPLGGLFLGTEGASADAAIEAALATRSPEQLQEMVDWFSTDGPTAFYVLLRNNFPVMRDRLTENIAADFNPIRDATLSGAERDYGQEGRQYLEREWAKLDSFVRSQFLEAGMRAALEREPSLALEKAREIIAKKSSMAYYASLFEVAAKIIGKAGNSEDVPVLLMRLPDLYAEAKAAAVQAAITLAREEQQELLLGSKLADLVIGALTTTTPERVRILKERIYKLLNSDDAKLRTAAVVAFERALNQGELEGLLESYLSQRSYFYNVVTWLDRLLYAPESLRSKYRRAASISEGPLEV